MDPNDLRLFNENVDKLLESLSDAEKPKRKAILDCGKLILDGQIMPFTFVYHGSRPKNGYSLFIGLHGGGSCPKEVNDEQYKGHLHLYNGLAKSGFPDGSVWFVPRAPENVWNMWHLPYVDKMLDFMIQSFIICGIADPNKVFLTGYAAGGDGVYKLAPRMADRLAGAAMSGGHPNGASILSLRNTAFTLHVGENDHAYNRNRVGMEYGEKFKVEKQKDPLGFDHFLKVHDKCGSWMEYRDFEGFEWLFTQTRVPLPDKVVWEQCSDVPKKTFYWLVLPEDQMKKGSLVTASLRDNSVYIESTDIKRIGIRLNDQMLSLQHPVHVYFNNIRVFEGLVERSLKIVKATILERFDTRVIFSAEIYVDAP
eukprot:Em0002g1693a